MLRTSLFLLMHCHVDRFVRRLVLVSSVHGMSRLQLCVCRVLVCVTMSSLSGSGIVYPQATLWTQACDGHAPFELVSDMMLQQC
jgi:hypothetical protein